MVRTRACQLSLHKWRLFCSTGNCILRAQKNTRGVIKEQGEREGKTLPYKQGRWRGTGKDYRRGWSTARMIPDSIAQTRTGGEAKTTAQEAVAITLILWDRGSELANSRLILIASLHQTAFQALWHYPQLNAGPKKKTGSGGQPKRLSIFFTQCAGDCMGHQQA